MLELSISNSLLTAININSILCCSWKDNQDLTTALAGDEDLDLLISEKHFERFSELLGNLGFREAANKKMSYPWIHHYYGLDRPTGKFLHVHAHFRLITGESHTKNYHLPVEHDVLTSCRVDPSGLSVPSPQWSLWLYLVRYYLKVSCVPGLLLVLRCRKSFRQEYNYIVASTPDRDAQPFAAAGIVSDGLLRRMHRLYQSERPTIRKIACGLRLRAELMPYCRYGRLRNWSTRYVQLTYRLVNKLLLGYRKRLVSGGQIIAITGLDGCGKTTIVKELSVWLGHRFDVRVVHVGKPPTTLATFVFRLLLNSARKIKKSNGGQTQTTQAKAGMVYAVRYAILAYERSVLLRKAATLRKQGFIVLCDRYPSQVPGRMDSPRIAAAGPVGKFALRLAFFENRLYDNMPVPDLLLHLQVPLATALERNRKRNKPDGETDADIRARFQENVDMRYRAIKLVQLDTSGALHQTLLQVKSLVWT